MRAVGSFLLLKAFAFRLGTPRERSDNGAYNRRRVKKKKDDHMTGMEVIG